MILILSDDLDLQSIKVKNVMLNINMKILATALLILLIVKGGVSQNYIEYQREITKAENLFFDTLYSASIKQYRKTFDAYEFNFPRDCMVAAQVAAYAKDDTSAFYFLRKAARFGASMERIKTTYRLRPLQKSPLWQPFLKDYDEQRKLYYAGINWPYRELCNKFSNKDNQLRDKDQAFFSNRYFVFQIHY